MFIAKVFHHERSPACSKRVNEHSTRFEFMWRERVIKYSQLASFLLLNVGIRIKGVQKHLNDFKYDLVLDLRK